MKNMRSITAPVILILSLFSFSCTERSESSTELSGAALPSLEKRGHATQLVVDGEPFLVLGGELHNSSSSSREYMEPYWPLLKASGMNTVLAAVEWSLVEPVEGEFDFTVGYSPFGFERTLANSDDEPVSKAYRILGGLAPLVLEAQKSGTITSVLLEPEAHPAEEVVLGNYKILVELFRGWGASPGSGERSGYCMMISSAPDEFILYGNNVQVSFSPVTPGPAIAGIARLDEGRFEEGKWIRGRRLNGDDIMLDYDLAGNALENKTGTGLKFGRDNALIQRVKLYRYE